MPVSRSTQRSRRISASSPSPWWQSPSGWIKGAGILSMSLLVWINLANRPNNNADSFFLSTKDTDAAMLLPRKLKLIDNEPGRTPLLRRTDEANMRGPITKASPGIVTFVDHRKADITQPSTPPHNQVPITRPQMSLKLWREAYNQACQDRTVTKEHLLETIQQIYQRPTTITRKEKDSNSIEPCRYTFLDFGANIGDSLGKFIDSGFDNCDSPQNDIQLSPKYNLNTGVMDQFYDHENVLVRYSRHVTRKAGRQPRGSPERYPEEYCYFGIEGNPVFTNRLRTLQQRINHSTSPRPVKKAHFFTETVGAGVDGPTTLYLDTVSTDKNFWGSSVLTQPKYVRESADRHNDGKPIEARVQGVTLSTMVKRTVKPEKDAHLLIKMDIEGGEYAVLQEVHKSGVLCDYVQKGVIVTMLLEKHAPQFQAANLDMELWDSFTKDLRDCGVTIQGGMSAGR